MDHQFSHFHGFNFHGCWGEGWGGVLLWEKFGRVCYMLGTRVPNTPGLHLNNTLYHISPKLSNDEHSTRNCDWNRYAHIMYLLTLGLIIKNIHFYSKFLLDIVNKYTWPSSCSGMKRWQVIVNLWYIEEITASLHGIRYDEMPPYEQWNLSNPPQLGMPVLWQISGVGGLMRFEHSTWL
jgi:hypothetical protein